MTVPSQGADVDKLEQLAALDRKIVAAVRLGHITFSQILFVIDPSRSLYRAVDRRLQSLRKRGALIYSRKRGWSAARQVGGAAHDD